MKVKLLPFLLIFVAGCDRISYELNKFSKEVEAEEAHFQKVADGTRVFDNDPEPKWPGIEGEKTLEGIDADNDGLRDDVEIWINEKVKENNLGHHGNLRRAIKQYARDQIKFILGYQLPRDELFKIHEQRMRSEECANFFWFLINEHDQDKNDYSKFVRTKIISTFERKQAHSKASDTLNSYSYNAFGAEPGELVKFCQFKVDYLEDYFNQYKKFDPRRYKNLKAEDFQ